MTFDLSVVIPAWNAERYLAEAIASVRAEIDPATELTLIVVDDGSDDATAQIASSLGAKVLSGPRQGIAAARNRGLAAVETAHLAFIDADDLWVPDRLAVQRAALATFPDARGLVLGHVEEFVSPELSAADRARLRPKPGRLPGWLMGALLTTREVFAAVGPFDPSLALGETIDWFHRAATLHIPHVVLHELVLRRRLHGDNATLRGAPTADASGAAAKPSAPPGADYVALAKRLLDRKRAARD
ncbi:MAG: glycosyltransferase [Deltaproteobacteria bacterium]|nr:glycosyltransferase [Deltaproteobacteria bacterium]